MKKDYKTLKFEQDVIMLLYKYDFVSDRLTPAKITINIEGQYQPLISITSKLKTEKEYKEHLKEMEKYYAEEDEFDEDLFDEDDVPPDEDDTPDFNYKDRM